MPGSSKFQPFLLGRYAVLAPLASGGMARVLLAEPVGLAGLTRPVVIKLILDHFAGDDQFIRMFVDEASIALNLSHPNVVQLLELQQEAGRFYMVLEWVDGPDLHRLLRAHSEEGKRMDTELAAFAVWSACCGLAHVHMATDRTGTPLNIVHRDVTPGNLLIGSNGTVKLSDFGVAKARGRLTHTSTGQIKGKLAYMAPEQVQGEVDQRSDLFSVGVVLWEALTGEHLFAGQSEIATMERVLRMPIPLPSTINKKASPALDAITMRALERDPALRYQRAEEMAEDILQALGGRHPDKFAQALAKTSRRYFNSMTPEQISKLPRPRTGAVAMPMHWGVTPAAPQLTPRTVTDSPAASFATTVPTVVAPAPSSAGIPFGQMSPHSVVEEVGEEMLVDEDEGVQPLPPAPDTMLQALSQPVESQLFADILATSGFHVRSLALEPSEQNLAASALWTMMREGRLDADARVSSPAGIAVDGRTLAQRLMAETMVPLVPDAPSTEWASSRPRSLVHDLQERMVTGALLLRFPDGEVGAVLWLDGGNLACVHLRTPDQLVLDALLGMLDADEREQTLTTVIEQAVAGTPLHASAGPAGLVARGRFRLMLDAYMAQRMQVLVERGVWEHALVTGVKPPFDLPPAAMPVTEFLPGGSFGAGG